MSPQASQVLPASGWGLAPQPEPRPVAGPPVLLVLETHPGGGRALAVDAEARPVAGAEAEDLCAALAQLSADVPRLPRRAILLCDGLTVACLEVPSLAGLEATQAEGLVRWELEPYVGEGELRCGWSTLGEGPLYAVGLSVEARARELAASARAGVAIEALYPRFACAGALAEVDHAQVIELGPEGLALSELREGRVVRFRHVSVEPSQLTRACLDAVDPELPVVLAGAAPAALLERLLPDARVGPSSQAWGASLMGAARHALGLSGGERLAAVRASDPRPPLAAQSWVRWGLLALSLALAVVGVEVGLGRSLREARAQVAAQDARQALAARRASAQRAHVTQRKRLSAERTLLEARAAVHARRLSRVADLPARLDAVADSLPADAVLDALVEEEGRLRVQGFSLSAEGVERFSRDLERALRSDEGPPLGRVLRVRRGKSRSGAEGYRFTLELERTP
jgi:hypothetical protein